MRPPLMIRDQKRNTNQPAFPSSDSCGCRSYIRVFGRRPIRTTEPEGAAARPLLWGDGDELELVHRRVLALARAPERIVERHPEAPGVALDHGGDRLTPA